MIFCALVKTGNTTRTLCDAVDACVADFAHHRACRCSDRVLSVCSGAHARVRDDITGPDIGEKGFKTDTLCAGRSKDCRAMWTGQGLRSVDRELGSGA